VSGVWSQSGPRGPTRRISGSDIDPPDPVRWRARLRSSKGAASAQSPHLIETTRAPRWLDGDGWFALALFLPLLFIAQLTTAGAAAVAGLAPLYVFHRRKDLGRLLLPRTFLFAVPAFAILSVIWSEAPSESLRFAGEFVATVIIGLLLSSARSQESVIRGLTLAFLIYIVVARVGGGTVGIGVGAGGEAFSGLTSSKNLLGDIASTGLIVSMAALVMAARQRRWEWLAIGGVAAGLDFFTVVATRSAGALLGLGMGLAAMLALTPLVYAGKVIRGWVTCAVALCLIIGGLFSRTLSAALIDFGANLFDKDPTLTGRTYLWYRAADLIQEKPLLGRGYYAFWRQGNLDAEGLWRYFGIDNRGGFTFHNTLVDILVTLGWLGALVIFAVVVVGMAALIRKFVMRPSLSLVFWISILLYQLVRTPIETIGIAPFYFSTVLAFAALGAAFRRSRPAPTRRSGTYRQAHIVALRSWTIDDAEASASRVGRFSQGVSPRQPPGFLRRIP
jgi:exopolysaccharide production protein ExoQ